MEIVHKEQRIIIIKFEHENETYICASVYSPNKPDDKVRFYSKVSTIINAYTHDDYNVIIGGDMNCVVNSDLDNNCGRTHTRREIDGLNNLVNSIESFDLWRIHNDDRKEYTWKHRSSPIMRRLDYIFGNQKVVDKSIHSEIVDIPLTDHRSVIVDIQTAKMKFGKYYWKFNNQLLKDREYVTLINDTIINVNHEYTGVLDNQIKWEFCKKQIKKVSIEYAKTKAKICWCEIQEARVNLSQANTILAEDPQSVDKLNVVNRLELELNIKQINDSKGAQLRSKAQWISEGERNTKYFLTLEKIHGQQKIMSELEVDNQLINNQNDIMREQHTFYKQLYQKNINFNDADLQRFCDQINVPKVRDNDRDKCEQIITACELEKMLKTMKNDSSPVIDGLTAAAWYKMFWVNIKQMGI